MSRLSWGVSTSRKHKGTGVRSMSDQVGTPSLPSRWCIRSSFWFLVVLVGGVVSVLEGCVRMLLCAGVVLSSFFLHELARYLAGRACGYRAHVVLTALGPNMRFQPDPGRMAFVLLRLTGPATSLAV